MLVKYLQEYQGGVVNHNTVKVPKLNSSIVKSKSQMKESNKSIDSNDPNKTFVFPADAPKELGSWKESTIAYQSIKSKTPSVLKMTSSQNSKTLDWFDYWSIKDKIKQEKI